MTVEQMLERAKQFRIKVEPDQCEGRNGPFALYNLMWKFGTATGTTTIPERQLLETLSMAAQDMAKTHPELEKLLPFAQSE